MELMIETENKTRTVQKVTKGGEVPGNPNLWRIVEGNLYLNITPNVVILFE